MEGVQTKYIFTAEKHSMFSQDRESIVLSTQPTQWREIYTWIRRMVWNIIQEKLNQQKQIRKKNVTQPTKQMRVSLRTNVKQGRYKNKNTIIAFLESKKTESSQTQPSQKPTKNYIQSTNQSVTNPTKIKKQHPLGGLILYQRGTYQTKLSISCLSEKNGG